MLQQSCNILPGVGAVLAERLTKCGIQSVADLLFHLPFRYQDKTRITPMQDLRANEYAVVLGRVVHTELRQGKRAMLYCSLEDKTGRIVLRFFHFNKPQIKALEEATLVRAFGEVKSFANQFEIIHPEYKLLQDETEIFVDEALTPIYPSTEGLSQSRLRQLVQKALEMAKLSLAELEWMTEPLLAHYGFLTIQDALHCLHNPPADTYIQQIEEGSHPALQRLVFDELLAHRLSMQFARSKRALLQAPKLEPQKAIQASFLNQLAYALTGAQARVVQEIEKDLAQDKPMLRLVQGDVGCGKTTVAALAALQAVANGYQVAIMAPTDLLSEQLTAHFQKWFKPLDLVCERLTGKMTAKHKRTVAAELQDHTIHCLIGTHALFQEDVIFAKLGLIIIDEQHRFGVQQRLLLQKKGHQAGCIPHQLLMTATPIPRTLTMTHYAHLDVSIIDELPPNRLPVNTVVIQQEKRDAIIERLKAALNQGKQAYWVCTLVEESEKLQCMAATETAALLGSILPDISVGLVHGRLKATEKEAIMLAFKAGDIRLLVATTVIEVGVDVPNASLMIIENAERLGLSQMHQLRGRVGRGTEQSHCILLYQNPLSLHGSERLQVMRGSNDGFLIAEKDLAIRGGGEILGTRQAGFKQFKVLDLRRDADLIPEASKVAEQLVRDDLNTAQSIARRWLGDYEQFLQG